MPVTKRSFNSRANWWVRWCKSLPTRRYVCCLILCGFLFCLLHIWVCASLLIITYSYHPTYPIGQFLPALLGPLAPSLEDDYTGFDVNMDPTIINSFSTVAFRLGHSLVSSNLQLADDGGIFGSIPMRDVFFSPPDALRVDHLIAGAIQSPVRYLLYCALS